MAHLVYYGFCGMKPLYIMPLSLLEMSGHCSLPNNFPLLIYYRGLEETLRLKHHLAQ